MRINQDCVKTPIARMIHTENEDRPRSLESDAMDGAGMRTNVDKGKVGMANLLYVDPDRTPAQNMEANRPVPAKSYFWKLSRDSKEALAIHPGCFRIFIDHTGLINNPASHLQIDAFPPGGSAPATTSALWRA
jgi:hypothetical protein